MKTVIKRYCLVGSILIELLMMFSADTMAFTTDPGYVRGGFLSQEVDSSYKWKLTISTDVVDTDIGGILI